MVERDYRRLVEREYRLLAAEAAEERPNAARSMPALRAWRALYRERRRFLRDRPDGARWARADAVFTYVEGVARYVEAVFLIDPTFHLDDDASGVDPSFARFQASQPPTYAGMVNKKLGAHYYYALGMHLALLLDRVDPRWKQRVAAHPELLLGVALDAPPPAPRRHARALGRAAVTAAR